MKPIAPSKKSACLWHCFWADGDESLTTEKNYKKYISYQKSETPVRQIEIGQHVFEVEIRPLKSWNSWITFEVKDPITSEEKTIDLRAGVAVDIFRKVCSCDIIPNSNGWLKVYMIAKKCYGCAEWMIVDDPR